jgi:hypothetical protein
MEDFPSKTSLNTRLLRPMTCPSDQKPGHWLSQFLLYPLLVLARILWGWRTSIVIPIKQTTSLQVTKLWFGECRDLHKLMKWWDHILNLGVSLPVLSISSRYNSLRWLLAQNHLVFRKKYSSSPLIHGFAFCNVGYPCSSAAWKY